MKGQTVGWALAVTLMASIQVTAKAGSAPEPFQFSLINGTYSNPNPDIAPVKRGLVTIQLRSPANEVQLLGHRLTLQPLPGGLHAASLQLEMEGEGQLEADLTVSGVSTELEDDVVLPRQTIVLDGQIRLERAGSGYRITAVELPPELKLRIQSRLAGSLVETCKRFTLLIPLGFGCTELERSLAEATVPLPEEGETFLLSDSLLTQGDRRKLDAYLSRPLAATE